MSVMSSTFYAILKKFVSTSDPDRQACEKEVLSALKADDHVHIVTDIAVPTFIQSPPRPSASIPIPSSRSYPWNTYVPTSAFPVHDLGSLTDFPIDNLSVPSTSFGSFSSAAESLAGQDCSSLYIPASPQLEPMFCSSPQNELVSGLTESVLPSSSSPDMYSFFDNYTSDPSDCLLFLPGTIDPYLACSPQDDLMFSLDNELQELSHSFPQGTPALFGSLVMDDLMGSTKEDSIQPKMIAKQAEPGETEGRLSPRKPCSSSSSASSSSRRIHTCPVCQHTSNRANNMKEHILTHNPNRPKNFVCCHCSKPFARKHDMKRHVRSHEKYKIRACGGF